MVGECIKADLVIHYGDARMSKVEDIPVYYTFGQISSDILYNYSIEFIYNELNEECLILVDKVVYIMFSVYQTSR